MEITKAQIKQIHLLKTKLGWDDETYRNALRPYFVNTSKELTFSEARTFIAELKAFVFKHEIAQMATEKQRKMIIAKWYGVSRAVGIREKMTALNTFLQNRFGIKNLNALRRDAVEKVVKTLNAMAEQEEHDANAEYYSAQWTKNEDEDAAMESHAMD